MIPPHLPGYRNPPAVTPGARKRDGSSREGKEKPRVSTAVGAPTLQMVMEEFNTYLAFRGKLVPPVDEGKPFLTGCLLPRAEGARSRWSSLLAL